MTYNDIKKSLALIENPVDKLEMVMDLGKTLSDVPNGAKCDEILGCSSFVEICQKDGQFFGRADSLMVRGIVAIILSMVDGKSISEIKKIDMEAEFRGLNLNFGAARLNGIQSMISFFKNL
jgi:cysteine desulfuration protein SufE